MQGKSADPTGRRCRAAPSVRGPEVEAVMLPHLPHPLALAVREVALPQVRAAAYFLRVGICSLLEIRSREATRQ